MPSSADRVLRPEQNLIDLDGEVYYLPGFVPKEQADLLLSRLQTTMNWEQEFITIVGRTVAVPRLVAWHGDEGAVYRYSGLTHDPQPWTPELRALREKIAATCCRPFNSVLGNWYRDGKDSMGWHADKEKALGTAPWIASLSLGQERLFKLRHNRTDRTLDLRLAHGSLLVMGGKLQHCWRHCVPKSPPVDKARINLTFRNILFDE